MSEDSTDDSNDVQQDKPSHSSKRTKKDEIFGFPKDDLTLGIAAAAGLGVLGVGAKLLIDAFNKGEIPNPFAPNPNPRITYSDIYEQQKAQQDWQAQQQQQQQQQPLPAVTEQQQDQTDPNFAAQTMPSFQGFDDTEDGVSYSTAPPKRGTRFDRINGG